MVVQVAARLPRMYRPQSSPWTPAGSPHPPQNGGDQPGPRALSKRAKCAFGSGIDPTIAFHLCQRLPPCFFNGADQLCRKMAFQERLKRGQVEAPFCPCSIGYL